MLDSLGIRHLALKVKNFEECLTFYTKVIGMKVDWKPDDHNVYLTNGIDNLALHYDEGEAHCTYVQCWTSGDPAPSKERDHL